MTDLETGEEIWFGGSPLKEAYLDAYGAHISGNRGKGEVRGAKMTYESDQLCKAGQNYHLEQVVECSYDYDEQGEGYILKVQGETSCEPLIIIYHRSGCDDQFVSDYAWLLFWKPEINGSILLLMGSAMGWVGKKYFSYIALAPIPLTIIHSVLFIGTSMTKWHKNTIFYLLAISALLLVSILIILFMRNRRFFPITITFLGCLYGFYLGDFFAALFYRISKWESLEFTLTIQILFVITFGVIAFRECRKSFKNLTRLLALLASIMLIKGFSQYLGGWPMEIVSWSLLKNGKAPLYESNIESVYLFLIIISSIIYFFWLNAYKL